LKLRGKNVKGAGEACRRKGVLEGKKEPELRRTAVQGKSVRSFLFTKKDKRGRNIVTKGVERGRVSLWVQDHRGESA